MQDFESNSYIWDFQRFFRYPERLARPYVGPKEDIESLTKSLKQSPERMYLHSLATHEKLPAELHEAMLVWSFDPKQSEIVAMYVNWVEYLEKHNKSREDFERSCRMQDKVLFGCLVFCSITLLFVILLT